MSDWELAVKGVKFNRTIDDPFPHHTAYQTTVQMLDEMRSPLEKLFRIKFSDHHIPKPESVSIHAAYRMGYDKAYQEIIDAGPIRTPVVTAGVVDEKK